MLIYRPDHFTLAVLSRASLALYEQHQLAPSNVDTVVYIDECG